MIAHTFYEQDNRVRRYAEALAKRGDSVDVIALSQEGQSSSDLINGVRVFRIQQRTIAEKSKLELLAELLLFFIRSTFLVIREQVKKRYDLIHVHSVPDFEVFAAFYPKLMGSKIILDIHDIVPEFYASKFKTSENSLIFKVLVVIERMSTAFSDRVIVANHIWEKRLLERSVKKSKCSTLLNFPDTEIFHRRGRTRQDNKFIIVYPGTLSYHQGVDLAIRAFSLIQHEVPEAEFHIYGDGDQLDSLRSLVAELGLQDKVFLKGSVPFDQMHSVMENADLGIVPKRKDNFSDEAFSTKILEYMAMGLPSIVPNTTIDKYYFNDLVVRFFEANNEKSLADAMLSLIRNPEARARLAGNATQFVQTYTWEENMGAYLNLVDSLVSSRNGFNA